jgi:hypothetical protein
LADAEKTRIRMNAALVAVYAELKENRRVHQERLGLLKY